MKVNDLFNAIADADDDMILNAKKPPAKRSFRKSVWISAIATVLAVTLLLGLFLFPSSPGSLSSYAIAETDYPFTVQYTANENDSEGRIAWRESKNALKSDYNELSPDISDFLYLTLGEFIKGHEGQNTLYSPINIYLAFAMLAEITDNNSRQQILNVLGCHSIETLRQNASAIWKASYSDDGAITSILSASVWLSESIGYRQETMEMLADIYYASSYQGVMGSDEYNTALRNWLNDHTGNLLEESVEKIELNRDTVMALATTLCFNARWKDTFIEQNTQNAIFHSVNGDISCEFMNGIQCGTLYTAESFTAICSNFETGSEKCGMWLILPDENQTAESVAQEKEFLELILTKSKGDSWENELYGLINLSLPKFDVTSNIDLVESMKNLGMTDIFNEDISDFSPMTDEVSEIVISSAKHSARVTVDEEGCTAAAFTVIAVDGTGAPLGQINFTLDRPFLFVITSDVGLPLFIGIVNQPQ